MGILTARQLRTRRPIARSASPYASTVEDRGILCSEDRVASGMWPGRLALWMVGFYVALYIIRPWEVLVPVLATIHFERIYALCMIAVILYTSRIRLQVSPQSTAVLLFFLAVTLSAAFAWDPLPSWERWYSFLTLVIFYFILRLVIRTPYELVFIVTCYITTVTVYMAKAQWEFFVHGRRDHTMGVVRLVGFDSTFGGPNALAMSIVVSLPMAYFLFIQRKNICARWPSPWRPMFVAGLILYALLAASSVILTNSRSGMLSAVVFAGLATLRGKSLSRKLLAGAGAVAVLAILWMLMSDGSKNRLRTVWDPQSASADTAASSMGRIEGLQAGLRMFETFPLTGVGVGNFIPYRVGNVDGVSLDPHNIVGQVLGETGIVGAITFTIFVAILVATSMRTRRLLRKQPGGMAATIDSFAVACQNALLLLLFEGLFFHNLLRFNWLWLAAFSGLALEFAGRCVPARRQMAAARLTRART